ncbi:hypothetical protein [Beijerinckia indica]|uniref:Uncharacterized protein n=1 Tax=Beijerinckia indica subsp. indica (strain ATCC 9039 / DSM 1715 / NCIMB 8712) TaxID=395963 RepID=B2II68_BEII9|nr:hypothetical protein [Beijerinckia indica]ACB94651.1 hypothetical protein Bind_1008 [Beijerinckia indica subsp. indica ATCC 9039]
MNSAKASACRRTVSPARGFITASALCLGLVLGLGAVAPAAAYEDTNPLNSLLGFVGMQFDKEEQEAIDYRARAPLVVPPHMDQLPAPVARKEQDAAWPKDPDVLARKRAAADSHRPAPQVNLNTRAELSPQELARGKTDKTEEPGGKPDDGCQATAGTAMCVYAPWNLLKKVMHKDDEEVVNVGDEPSRKYLTEPPAGYRAATKTTHFESDKNAKATVDAGDAAAYTRSQGHKSAADAFDR